MSDIWKWIDENSGVLSIILSLIGFIILAIQTRKARSAAESARLATEDVIRSVSHIDTISDLARIRSEMNNIQLALRGGRYEAALLHAQSIREGLSQLRSRKGFESDKMRAQIQLMATSLRKLQDNLELKLDDPEFALSVSGINSNLSEYSVIISGWMEEMRFSSGGLQK
ncbi:MAG: hypothetical protein L0229_23305 [Blastocatellia bacterium]|nr:hypothetical protein [Blastocatellia bacterium]